MRIIFLACLTLCVSACTTESERSADEEEVQVESASNIDAAENAIRHVDTIAHGRRIFRYDTFGDEAFWGGKLRLHEAVATISPKTALAVGLKVDLDALPKPLVKALRKGEVNLDDPATTLALLKLNAVVGVTGHFNEEGKLSSMGVQCALCHSTVDNALAPGIGRRLDGWPNRDLDVGTIVSLSPDLSPFTELLGVDAATVKTVLTSWGPGRYDAALILDGKAFRPDGKTAATLIPSAFGLAGTNLATFTGWGSVPHWNAFVAVLEMHGQGNFSDSRLNDARFPVAQRAGFARVTSEVDLVTPKLAALQAYQLSLKAPKAPHSNYKEVAAARGKQVFNGAARCAECHVPPLFTEPGFNLHTPAEMGIDSFQAERSPTQGYRTTPLGGLHARSKGGYYHDGRFSTLAAVVKHYETNFNLNLNDYQRDDLLEYLKSF